MLPRDETISEANRLFTRALDLVSDQTDDMVITLKTRIYNNRCFFLVNLDATAFRDIAVSDLQQLNVCAKSNEPDAVAGTSLIADTILWAEWKLFVKHFEGNQHNDARNDIVEKYERLRNRAHAAFVGNEIYARLESIKTFSR